MKKGARREALCLCVVMCVLSGCTVGPDYKLPFLAFFNGASENGSFVSTRGETKFVQTPVPDNWWKLYDDPRLDALVQRAIAANTDLRVAAADFERSRALLQQAKTSREPSVGLDGSAQYGQAAGEQFLQPVTPPSNWSYETGLNVGYDLDIFG